jgi:pyruvate kinase
MVASRQMRAPVIATVSDSGGAARLLSEYRPEGHIVAFTRRPEVYRQLAAYWGVSPEDAPDATTTDGMLEAVALALRDRGYARSGDLAVITLAVPLETGASTNLLHLHTIP